MMSAGAVKCPLLSAGGSDVGAAMPSRSMSDPDQEFDKEVKQLPKWRPTMSC